VLGPVVVAVGILTSGLRVLVVRRPDDGPVPEQWEFPGGKVEFGEHPWNALRRELWEELSLRVARGTLYGVYSHMYDIRGGRAHYVLVAYRMQVARHRVPETDRVRWVRLADLPRWSLIPGSRPIVADLARRRSAGSLEDLAGLPAPEEKV